MRSSFDGYMPELFKHEGGYVDHSADPGGATKFGITHITLKEWRGRPVTKGDVRQLTKEEASKIYRARYWNAIKADDLPAGVDVLAFDIAVNHGVARWKQWAPLIVGLSPDDAVRAVTERRRRFYRSLQTFKVFGKGWMRRANEVEAYALELAEKHQGDTPATSQPKPKTMRTSKTGLAAILFGSAGAIEPARRAVDAAKAATETASDAWGLVPSVGPWVLVALVIIGAAAFIWYDRRKKLVVYGV